MATEISSDTLVQADTAFKVYAGPGAGKTHWLSIHIKNVISSSKRLGSSRRIACISYTNVGADTILNRLSNESSYVEVCTIHSFLYNYIVRPFIHLEYDHFGIQSSIMRVVPIEPFLTTAFVEIVLNNIGQQWIPAESMLRGLNNSCRWEYKNGIFTEYKPRFPVKFEGKNGKQYSVPKGCYYGFLKYIWARGYITYDDVVYIAIELLRLHPKIFDVLVAQFPYFFIDEFQDSTPAIVDFVKKLSEHGSTVGVVGDKAQTIYDFIGASVDMFNSFSVNGMVEYEIHGNRRSTPQIVSLLNIVRPDFIQNSINVPNGSIPILIVGDRLNAYQKAVELCGSNDVHSLAFPNIIANAMRYKTQVDTVNKNLIDEDFDSDFVRGAIIKNLLKATEYAVQNDLFEAWRYLDFIDNDRTNTIIILRKLLNQRRHFISMSLYEFYTYVKTELFHEIHQLKKGTSKSFYESHTYMEMALSMKVADSDAIHKTIHKAKGEEYSNVMLVINNAKDISVLLCPDLSNKSTHRVYYVGMSRASQMLFINICELEEQNRILLSQLPLAIIDV